MFNLMQQCRADYDILRVGKIIQNAMQVNNCID